MLIDQADTAIDHFHSPEFQYRTVQKREAEILEVMKRGKDYTITELAYLTHMDKSDVSARRNGMLKKKLIVRGNNRKCKFTEVFVQTVKLGMLKGE